MSRRKNAALSAYLMFVIILVLTLFLAACSKSPASGFAEEAPVEDQTQSATSTPMELNSTSEHRKQPEQNEQPEKQEQPAQQGDNDDAQTSSAMQSIPLFYTNVEFPAITGYTIRLADIIEKQKLDHNLLVYALSADDEELRLGIVNEQTVQPFGEPFPQHYLDGLSVNEVALFGKQLLVVTAFCGANCALNSLLQLDSENAIPQFYFEIYGNLQFADIDDDKELEMLAYVGGTLPEIEVYRLIDESLMKVNINEALHADQGAVYNSKQHTFAAYIAEQQRVYRYSPTEHSLQMLGTD